MNQKSLDSLCSLGGCSKKIKTLKISKRTKGNPLRSPYGLSWNSLGNKDLSLVCVDLHDHQVKVTKLREVIENGI